MALTAAEKADMHMSFALMDYVNKHFYRHLRLDGSLKYYMRKNLLDVKKYSQTMVYTEFLKQY